MHKTTIDQYRRAEYLSATNGVEVLRRYLFLCLDACEELDTANAAATYAAALVKRLRYEEREARR